MAEKNLKFRKFLKKLIKENKLNNKKISDIVHVSAPSIGRYVNDGRVPEAPILQKLAELFGVTTNELLAGRKTVEKKAKKDEFDKVLDAHLEYEISEVRVYVDKLNRLLRGDDEKGKKIVTCNLDILTERRIREMGLPDGVVKDRRKGNQAFG